MNVSRRADRVELRRLRPHADQRDVLRVESLRVQQVREASCEENRATEQRGRERHLNRDELEARATAPASRRTTLEDLRRLGARRQKRRKKTERDRCDERNAEREPEHATIEADREIILEALTVDDEEAHQCSRRPDRQHDSEHTAEEGERPTLDEQLLHDAKSMRA